MVAVVFHMVAVAFHMVVVAFHMVMGVFHSCFEGVSAALMVFQVFHETHETPPQPCEMPLPTHETLSPALALRMKHLENTGSQNPFGTTLDPILAKTRLN